MLLSSEDKRGMPISSFTDAMGKLDDIDVNQITNKLITPDKHLPMITRVELPFDVAILDAYSFYLRDKGYPKTARNLHRILWWYRLNKCSENGWRADAIEGVLKAYAQRAGEDDEFNRIQRLGLRR